VCAHMPIWASVFLNRWFLIMGNSAFSLTPLSPWDHLEYLEGDIIVCDTWGNLLLHPVGVLNIWQWTGWAPNSLALMLRNSSNLTGPRRSPLGLGM
jgi:hypothetical protein